MAGGSVQDVYLVQRTPPVDGERMGFSLDWYNVSSSSFSRRGAKKFPSSEVLS